MSKLERLAAIPLKKIDEKVLEKIEDLDDEPSKLAKVIKLAKEQKPPNEAMIGAVGMVAYLQADEHDNERMREQFASVAELAFPKADIEVEPDRF